MRDPSQARRRIHAKAAAMLRWDVRRLEAGRTTWQRLTFVNGSVRQGVPIPPMTVAMEAVR
jgi:hypothetical protein